MYHSLDGSSIGDLERSQTFRDGLERLQHSSGQTGSRLGGACGHDLRCRLEGPVKRVRVSVPFCDEGQQALSQLIQVSEVADAEPLSLQKTEPLLYLVHPGAMHRQKKAHIARVSRQPGPNLLAFMDTRVIQDQPDTGDGRRNVLIQL